MVCFLFPVVIIILVAVVVSVFVFVFVLPLCSAIVSATFFVKQKPSRKNKERGPNRNRVYQGGGVQGWAVQVSGKGKYIEPKAKGRRLTHDKKIKKKKRRERKGGKKEIHKGRQKKRHKERKKNGSMYIDRVYSIWDLAPPRAA